MKTTIIYYSLMLTATTVAASTRDWAAIQRRNGQDLLGRSIYSRDEATIGHDRRGLRTDSHQASWILHSLRRQGLEDYDNEDDQEEEEEVQGEKSSEESEKLQTRGGKSWKPKPAPKEPDAPYDPNWKPPKMNINPDQKIVKNTLRCSKRTHKCKGMVLYENGSQTKG